MLEAAISIMTISEALIQLFPTDDDKELELKVNQQFGNIKKMLEVVQNCLSKLNNPPKSIFDPNKNPPVTKESMANWTESEINKLIPC
ncbi:hypothetical protein MHK_009573, partial [Candidatus Magnetomorum sp. HK-1]